MTSAAMPDGLYTVCTEKTLSHDWLDAGRPPGVTNELDAITRPVRPVTVARQIGDLHFDAQMLLSLHDRTCTATLDRRHQRAKPLVQRSADVTQMLECSFHYMFNGFRVKGRQCLLTFGCLCPAHRHDLHEGLGSHCPSGPSGSSFNTLWWRYIQAAIAVELLPHFRYGRARQAVEITLQRICLYADQRHQAPQGRMPHR